MFFASCCILRSMNRSCVPCFTLLGSSYTCQAIGPAHVHTVSQRSEPLSNENSLFVDDRTTMMSAIAWREDSCQVKCLRKYKPRMRSIPASCPICLSSWLIIYPVNPIMDSLSSLRCCCANTLSLVSHLYLLLTTILYVLTAILYAFRCDASPAALPYENFYQRKPPLLSFMSLSAGYRCHHYSRGGSRCARTRYHEFVIARSGTRKLISALYSCPRS